MSTTRTLTTLRRRLAAAELDLLRQVCAEQAARIETLEAALARAELWEDNYFAAAEAARATGFAPGITQAGQVVMLPAPATH